MLISSNHDAGRGSVIIPMVTTMGAKPQSRAVRVFWKMKSMSKRRNPMAGSDARLRTLEEFLLLGTGIIFVFGGWFRKWQAGLCGFGARKLIAR